MGNQFSTLPVSSLTQGVQMVLLSLMVLSRKWPGTIRHYRQIYLNRPDPIAFMQVAVDTSGRVYDDFNRLLFLHAHREASAFANELPEELKTKLINELPKKTKLINFVFFALLA
jgi:hypothetical protein